MTSVRRIAVIASIALAVVLAYTAYAQGPGKGRGAGAGRQCGACPYAANQQGAGQGGWWTRVQPSTPEQKAFVDQVTKLHDQIRAKQLDLSQLKAANAPQSQIDSLTSDIAALRTDCQNLMAKNNAICQQMGVTCCAACTTKPCLNGQPCPYGKTPCGAQGGWWNNVQPTTKEEKAFVDKVKSLNSQIQTKQLELSALTTAKASQSKINKVQQESMSLVIELQNLMASNKALQQKLMTAAGCGKGACGKGQGAGRGCGNCPWR